jgi:hypothetical protein
MPIFRCVWCFTFYSWRNLLRCFCCFFLHVVILCMFSFVFFSCVLVSWFLCACLLSCLSLLSLSCRCSTLHVSAYMAIFRCVWCFTFYSWRNLLRCFCCLFLHVVILCSFSFVFFCCVFVSFLILVCVFAFCLSLLSVGYSAARCKNIIYRKDSTICINIFRRKI